MHFCRAQTCKCRPPFKLLQWQVQRWAGGPDPLPPRKTEKKVSLEIRVRTPSSSNWAPRAGLTAPRGRFEYVPLWNEPVHEISNNVVCATSNASDQPAQKWPSSTFQKSVKTNLRITLIIQSTRTSSAYGRNIWYTLKESEKWQLLYFYSMIND